MWNLLKNICLILKHRVKDLPYLKKHGGRSYSFSSGTLEEQLCSFVSPHKHYLLGNVLQVKTHTLRNSSMLLFPIHVAMVIKVWLKKRVIYPSPHPLPQVLNTKSRTSCNWKHAVLLIINPLMFYFSTDFTKICFPEDNFLKSQYLFTCL